MRTYIFEKAKLVTSIKLKELSWVKGARLLLQKRGGKTFLKTLHCALNNKGSTDLQNKD
jgi:hypothetical protein